MVPKQGHRVLRATTQQVSAADLRGGRQFAWPDILIAAA